MEEEVSREKAQRRKVQRELEDLVADNESKEREITNLKNKLRYEGADNAHTKGVVCRAIHSNNDFFAVKVGTCTLFLVYKCSASIIPFLQILLVEGS